MMAAAVAIAGGTQANATPVRFDNAPHGDPGHFHWPPATPSPDITWLDITLDASAQPGASDGPASFGHKWTIEGDNSSVRATSSSVGQLEVQDTSSRLLVPLALGDMIPAGNPLHYYAKAYDGGSLLPEGVETYLGVHFNGPDWQYGWIGVVRTGLELDAFAWGYETEVGVPIAAGAPEPGTLATLAVGAAALLGRHRRRASQID